MSLEILIRLATAADVNAMTELQNTCFKPEDNIPVMLGKHYVQTTYRWQVGCKQAYTLVAETDGTLWHI